MRAYHAWVVGEALVVLLLLNVPLFAQSAAIDTLIVQGEHYDTKDVVIEGEAIGNLMQRAEFAWLNVNDGQAAIGVWAKKDLFDVVRYIGRYAVQGDMLRIRGTFYKSCPMHGGDTDIHAHALEVIVPGSAQYHPPDPKKKEIIVVLIGILACLYIIKILKKRR